MTRIEIRCMTIEVGDARVRWSGLTLTPTPTSWIKFNLKQPFPYWSPATGKGSRP
jgi:hypothetical protein